MQLNRALAAFFFVFGVIVGVCVAVSTDHSSECKAHDTYQPQTYRN